MKKLPKCLFIVAIFSLLAATPSLAGGISKKHRGHPSNKGPLTETVTNETRPQKVENKKGGCPLTPHRESAPKGFATPRKAPAYVKAQNSPMKAAANFPTLYASVAYSDKLLDETYDLIYGLYSVPTNNNSEFELLWEIEYGVDATFGGAEQNGIYYLNYYWEYPGGMLKYVESYGYDVSTGEQVYYADISSVPEVLCSGGMALDPTTNEIYGISMTADQEGQQLAKIDYTKPTPTVTVIAPLEGIYGAFAIDNKGQFYGIKIADGDNEGILCKIDRQTGASTVVGPTGQFPYYMTGACIDPKTNRMFWAVSPENTRAYLVELDPATGKASFVCRFSGDEQLTGLFVPAPRAADGAPNECEDVALNFNQSSLTGTVTFKAPATLFNGTAITGNVTVNLLMNDEPQPTLTVAAGASGTFNVTVPEAGLYTFTIFASNEAGEGVKTSYKKIWIGADTPASTQATLQYANGNMEISWLPVTEGLNGGYINPSEVTYTVEDNQGNIIADGLTVTSYSYKVEEPESLTPYYYNVYVEADGLKSAPARTNVVALGAITPPYKADFIANGFVGWTIIDGNNDGLKWEIDFDGSLYMEYNRDLDMDDWLITPPVKLEAGKAYNVAFEAQGMDDYHTEKIEVKWGKTNTAEGMTNTLIAPTEITINKYEQLSNMIVPSESGLYYIGFHGISDADQHYLFLNDIQIKEGVSNAAPGLPTNLTATPERSGRGWNCTIAFNAPTVTMADVALTSLTKVEIYRDNTLIKTFETPAVGAALSYTDIEPPFGKHTYTVTGYNEVGTGLSASVTLFVGIDIPLAPEVVNMTTTDIDGQVLLTWTPVTEDINGTLLTPEDVTYTISYYNDGEWITAAEDLKTTTYSWQAVRPGNQEFIQTAVFAVDEKGVSDGTTSGMMPVGTPYKGLDETFANGEPHYNWGIDYIGAYYFVETGIAGDDTFKDVQSVAGDDGFFYIYAGYPENGASLISGLVSLQEIVNPALSFYVYNVYSEENGEDINEISVAIRETNQETWNVILEPTKINDLCNGLRGEWGRIILDLDKYAGKKIQFMISGLVQKYTTISLDDIKIGSEYLYDLAIDGIAAPGKVLTGSDYTVEVTVTNNGIKPATSYMIELYADGSLAESKTGMELAGGRTATYTFERTMSALDREDVEYYAKAVYSLDEDMANNQSASITVVPVVSTLPDPDNLRAANAQGGVQLTWDEPDLEGGVALAVTDDFEDAESFAKEYGGWTFVDVDGKEVGGIQLTTLPNIIPGSTKGSFWIWDTEAVEVDDDDAYSGNKCLFSLYNNDGTNADNWAISPLLYGGAQTISFYARSFKENYPEQIQVLYTTQDVIDQTTFSASDFKVVAGSTVYPVPFKWTRYEYDLPAGAKHFAIRSFDQDAYILFVDDVTYTPAGSTAELILEGYNIYRNGQQINDAPVVKTSYLDLLDVDATYTYAVTAVYEGQGESAGSNAVTIDFKVNGIEYMEVSPSITIENRNIVINDAEGMIVTVADAAGTLIFNGYGSRKTVVNVNGGVYIVNVAGKTSKVLVK